MKERLLLLTLIVGLFVKIEAKAQTFYICEQGNTSTTSSLSFTNNGQQINEGYTPSGVDSITLHVPDLHFVGGDLSMLPQYERQKAKYLDANGKSTGDLLAFLRGQGWNTIRVRLFVDPQKGQANITDGSKKCVIQDMEYVKALGKRIKDVGMLFMLDFHYSDSWADPAQQWTPDDWKSLTDAQLQEKIYEYTADCLTQLNDAGASPDFIQTGNEISYGMMWGTKSAANNNNVNRCYTNSSTANWNRFTGLLKQATAACRKVCPRAKIIIHSERVAKPSVLTDFYDRMKKAAIDYDIIGLSYYPYYHGKLEQLESALTQIENRNYGKRIQIVETGYPSQYAINGSEIDYSSTYPYTKEGQKNFTLDLITLLKKHPLVNGLSWWYAEANAKGTTGDLSTGWYNAGLFDNNTGKALPAVSVMKEFR